MSNTTLAATRAGQRKQAAKHAAGEAQAKPKIIKPGTEAMANLLAAASVKARNKR